MEREIRGIEAAKKGKRIEEKARKKEGGGLL